MLKAETNKQTIQCFVKYPGEDFSECLKTGQYLLNQKWNEIQNPLMATTKYGRKDHLHFTDLLEYSLNLDEDGADRGFHGDNLLLHFIELPAMVHIYI